MRLTCPFCGTRDRREFTYRGDAVGLSRPASTEWGPDWDDYLHNRDNPAGETRELWYHDACGAWIEVTRDTLTHEVAGSRPVAEARR
ncbi:MAG: sarcosine oxidase subunit delta [Paracoccaceae bacterium]|nr:sarcosine oxidase subunit delta [Paracoccaceae bacterium]